MEVMRHNQEDENRVNTTPLARKHEVKIVATNNTFYIDKGNAHTIFCCVCAKVKTNDTNRSWSWLSVRFA
jgi:DNA polymerase III alpha subunit